MISKILLKMFLLVLIVLMSTETFAKVAIWRNIPTLIKDSSVIAKGKISIEDDRPVLSAQKIFKGESYSNLTIQWRELFDNPIPEFQNGETVLLFLEKPDEKGAAYLVGHGTQAKWPKAYDDPNESSGYPEILDSASLEDIENIVEKILQIENTVEPNERVELCGQYIKSPNQLVQLTTMQYILDDLIWPSSDDPNQRISHAEAKRRFGIKRKLSSDLLQLIDSDESAIQVESIGFLRYAHPNVAMPNLIRKITDANPGVRSATRTILNTLSLEFKIKGSFVDYKHSDSAERLNSIQQQWNAWLEKNRDRLKSIEQR